MLSKLDLVPLKYRDTFTQYVDSCAENILRLQDIWEDCGIEQSKLDSRMHKLFIWFQERWSTIIDDELQELEAKRERVQTALKDLEELSLQLEIDGPKKPENLNLQQQLDWVDVTTSKMDEIRVARLAQLDDLLSAQKSIIATMTDLKVYELPKSKIIPSERELQELQTHVTMARKEKRMRLDKLCPILDAASRLMESMGKIPNKEIEDRILCTPSDQWDLTQTNIQLAADTLEELEAEERELQARYATLRSSLLKLFDRLEITQVERDELLADVEAKTYQSIRRLEDMVEEYEELKKANMGRFVDRLKLEAEEWTKNLRTGEALAPIPGEPSEELVAAYEKLIESLKEKHAKLTPLFKLLDEKASLMEMLHELEEAQKDPNRYKNRGGALLLETKKRERVNKNLPLVVKQIVKFLDSYEPINGPVNIDGKPIRDEISILEEKKSRQNNTTSFTPLKASRTTPSTPATTNRLYQPSTTRSGLLKRAGTYTELKPKASSLRTPAGRKAPDTVGKVYTRQMTMKSPNSKSTTKLTTVKTALRKSTSYGDFESIMNANDRQSTRILQSSNGRKRKLF
ncbi:protein regulator of cytokinesis 1 [Galendromus occidentalis]|uniref:Protein regulator of cytokinesis 1 n=1 Tax=Galendromus occidentalis TaxID=34638 RepID=A0AAJ6QTC5_9ACAR|nr:protein regulator of cytokinesis 1 [Galendromus occidentalis]